MGRTVEAGILVKATDAASNVLRGIGTVSKESLAVTREAAAKAADAFKAIGVAGALLNQGLELARKGFELLNRTVGDAIRESLEFREVNDPLLKQFRDMQREVRLTKAAIGDVLLPVVVGIATAFDTATGSTKEWVRANRVMLGLKLVEFLAEAATLLVKGIAQGTILVARAWTGWSLIVEGLKVLFAEVTEFQLNMIAAGLEGMAKLAEATGADGLAGTLNEAAKATRDLAEDFGGTSDDAQAAMAESIEALDALEKKVRKVEIALVEGIGQGAITAMEQVRTAVAGIERTQEEQKKSADDRKKLQDERNAQAAASAKAVLARRFADIDAEADKFEDGMRRQDEALQAQAEASIAAAAQTGAAWGTALGQAIAGAEDAEDAVKQLGKQAIIAVLNAAKTFIIAKATEAGASAYADSVEKEGVPLGLVIGAGFAAAAIAAVTALISRLQDGGFVTGGLQGRDSVPALLAPGEFVMSRGEVSGFQKFAKRMLGEGAGQQLANAAQQTRTGSQAPPTSQVGTINFNNQMMFPDRVMMGDASRRQSTVVNRLQQRGIIVTRDAEIVEAT